MTEKATKIREFILEHIENHSENIASLLSEEFGFSRQAANLYLAKAVEEGVLVKIGNTRSTKYFLAGGEHIEFNIKIQPSLSEDKVWSKYIKPMILNYPPNIREICFYGFTEIFNNVIDHSDGTSVYVSVKINKTSNTLTMNIMDNGVGIFQKIKKALDLTSVRESILHLSKGKFTTDPKNHSGEGIFFTSRIFDRFSILSDDIFYSFEKNDWCLSSEKQEEFGNGTFITMVLSLTSKKTPKEIMDQYADEEIGFGKTKVAVALSADPNDPHISRSQAKRLMMGLEKFSNVYLDFQGVISVGQAFVDQVFRVWKNEHPHVKIDYINANKNVEYMIKRGSVSSNEKAL